MMRYCVHCGKENENCAAVCSVVASILLYILDKRTLLSKWGKQILFGVMFGALAVTGTEFAVPIEGAVINARGGASLCAGLIFGAPACIIAGAIGGGERWQAVL